MSDSADKPFMTDDEMRLIIRRAYEVNSHKRMVMVIDGSYMPEEDVRELCFILGDYREHPNLFSALVSADSAKLAKGVEFCQSNGFASETL